MSYGRILGGAARMGGGQAVAVLKSSPAGRAVSGVISGVKSLLGGGAPADRNASLRLRALGKAALAGDRAAYDQVLSMAQRQGSKFRTINAAAVRWAEKLRANQIGTSGVSPSTGAAPAGLLAGAGGMGARPRPRKVKRASSRSSSSRRRKKSSGRYITYKGKRYTRAQARHFVPRNRR